jgi:RNA polymerase sigma factor (sigma-70 family)
MTASMSTAMPDESSSAKNPLGDPALRKSLTEFVRRRVPSSDADDVVQIVLLDALGAAGRPDDPRELLRWLYGIARHKVADYHRRAHREPPSELPDIEAGPEPIEARELVRWAEEQVGGARDAKETLRWMAREGEGEKLESIAAEEQVPAARVRQRVSRMRRWMKERWLAELAAVATLTVVAIVVWWILRERDRPEEARPERPGPSAPIQPDSPSPLEQARALRDDGLRKCERSDWKGCLDSLDKARALDPVGDADPVIGAAREQARKALESDAPAPSSTLGPVPLAPVPTGAVPSEPDKKLDTPSPKAPSTATAPAPKDAPRRDKKATTPGFEKKPMPSGKTGKPSGSLDFTDGKK